MELVVNAENLSREVFAIPGKRFNDKKQQSGKNPVPKALRNWFFVHFLVDVIFAIPLLIAPVFFLNRLGWQVVDPVTARLVAAALFGIGIESLLSYRSDISNYQGMLNLKIIWSLGAITGLTISLAQGDQGRPIILWLLLFVFIVFNILWVFWKIKLRPN